jgi:pimeloyl-ACP methyl ester carboxylesterase
LRLPVLSLDGDNHCLSQWQKYRLAAGPPNANVQPKGKRVNAMQRQLTKIAGMAVECFTAGEGRPLFFLHDELGFAPQAPFLELLCKRRRVIALSLPGFGESDLPLWIDCADDLSYVALSCLDQQGVQAVDIIGCSLGGWVAAELASKAPERVTRLVLAAPYGVKLGGADRLEFPDLFAMSKTAVAEKSFHDASLANVDAAALSDAEVKAIVRNRESFALFAWEPYLHNPKLSHRLERVTAPTLFIRGASDGIVSAAYVTGYAALFPNASATELPAAGHFVHLEQPDAFVSRALDFLDRN